MIEDISLKPQSELLEQFPEDYHDYVFKNGKLIGDFDNMYRYAKGIPWDQDKRCHHWYGEVGILMLKEHSPYETVLEVGCGLGYVSSKLKGFTGNSVEAFDISPEAIRKARRLHTDIHFYVDDITKPAFQPRQQYDLVVIRDVFWYIFEYLDIVIGNINACVKPNGFFYLCQSFPALDSSFVGKDVIPNPEALLTHFPNYVPVCTALLRNHHLTKDGPILHFLGARTG